MAARLGYVPGYHKGAYHALQRRLFGTRRFSRELEFRILRRWWSGLGARVLDLACGSGDFSFALAHDGRSVVGLDRDPTGLDAARPVLPHVPGLALVAGDASALPFSSRSFDVCLCNSSIEHFDRPEAAVREVARVLKPGGYLLVTTDAFAPDLTGPSRLLPARWVKPALRGEPRDALMRDHHSRVHHVTHYYTSESLSLLLAAQRFEVLEVRDYLAGWLPRLIYELHLLLRGLEFYNATSQRLFPLMYPALFLDRRDRPGYGVAALAVRR